jgi:hypothetical protein
MEEVQETTSEEEGSGTSQRSVKDRPSLILMKTTINLLSFQPRIRAIVKGSFEFRNTKNGARVIAREMAKYLAIKSHLEQRKINFYTFDPKSMKPINVFTRHLSDNTSAEHIAKKLLALDFSIISVMQMTDKAAVFCSW